MAVTHHLLLPTNEPTMKVLRLTQLVYLLLAIGVRRGNALPKLDSRAALRLRGGQSEDAARAVDAASSDQAEAKPSIEHTQPRTFVGFGTSLSDLKSSVAERSAQVRQTLKSQLEALREKRANLDMGDWKEGMQAVGPASVAVADWFYHDGELTFIGVYSLALLGASSGFHLFLYFITVGYACGILLPVLVALYVASAGPIENLTTLHSAFTVLWAIRAASFFLHREYVNWPQLHDKVVEVNKMARLNSKFFCWFIYSFFYTAMASPCVYRLKSGKSWGAVGKMALGLQGTGLLLESVADHQKSIFKGQPGNRNQWCNVGLFKFSPFPNYLGEITFWSGTFIGGLACYEKPLEWVLATIGILFISVVIRGAVISLGAKQMRKYGENADFCEFRRTHTILGPNPFVKKPSPSPSTPEEVPGTIEVDPQPAL